jgi:hypothetical protein
MMFKKIFFGLSALALFTACTDDYTDWEKPQQNPEVAAKTVEWSVSAAQQAAIALDNVEGETVKLLNVSLPEGASVDAINVKLTADGANYPDYNITADGEGFVSLADLQKATTEMFTVEAVERTFAALVSADVLVKGLEGDAAIHLEQAVPSLTIIPQKPKFAPFIYFIGATDGWAVADQKLASPAGDGNYTGFCYVADPNGWGIAFKFQRVSGSWDNEINAGTFTTKTGVTGDNNIEVAEEGVYYFEVNLAKNSISATKVDCMGIIGDFNGWGGDAVMTWNPAEFCYEATGAGVNANGWKFRVNNDWAINLGGNDDAEPSAKISDLVANGKNLGVVGNTIKLYPTRKTSDKIYCTVE